jgi:hypothetical protein
VERRGRKRESADASDDERRETSVVLPSSCSSQIVDERAHRQLREHGHQNRATSARARA